MGTPLIRQRARVLRDGDKWMVRDEHHGPFGPVGVSREVAEAWLADDLTVTIVGVLHDHHHDYTRYNQAGNRPCVCGAKSPDDCHIGEMVAARLRAAGLSD